MSGVLVYRPRATALHAARALVAAAWTASLIASALLLYHPLALTGLALAAVLGMAAADARREIAGALRLVAIVALPTVIVNVLVVREGLTVFLRLGDLGPFGQGDLTVEALLYGLVIAMKVGIVIVLGLLASFAIDPDELLGLCRRLSFRSALTASIALRMVPLLAADAERLSEAQRTRPPVDRRLSLGESARLRALLLTATMSGALDRSMDVAATLELRGFAHAGGRRTMRSRLRRLRALRLSSPPAIGRKRGGAGSRPLSRHDIAFLCSAAAVLTLSIAARISGVASFRPYPLLSMPTSAVTVALCIALPVLALLPFLDRRGIEAEGA